MKLAVFDTHEYDAAALREANRPWGHEIDFFPLTLTGQTVTLARDHRAVCIFVHDALDEPALRALQHGGTELIALRCAGFNNVDLKAADALGLRVVRVPEYSPYAVAEHAMALLLALNRKLPRAYNRVRDGNFSLDGLVGFDLHGKTVGVIGLGRIGRVFARLAQGFGCRLLGYDTVQNPRFAAEIGLEYAPLEKIYRDADVISLHVPLFPETFHLLNHTTLAQMKPTALLINTSRGALINASDLIDALKSGAIAGAALDVYEEEEAVFFRDLSGQILQDDILARLVGLPNVLITSHQAFLTREALRNIAETTLANIEAFSRGQPLQHELTRCQAPTIPEKNLLPDGVRGTGFEPADFTLQQQSPTGPGTQVSSDPDLAKVVTA
jgi:D-lactate dehydrogenase